MDSNDYDLWADHVYWTEHWSPTSLSLVQIRQGEGRIQYLLKEKDAKVKGTMASGCGSCDAVKYFKAWFELCNKKINNASLRERGKKTKNTQTQRREVREGK
jgi:hypothetical protein